jgi:hypothetical protein
MASGKVMHDMDRAKRFIIIIMVATIVLASVTAFVTPPQSVQAANASKAAVAAPLSAGAANASKAAVAAPPHTVQAGNASTAAAKTPPIVGAAGWHIQTVDSSAFVGTDTSLALTSAGWPAISYYDLQNEDLKYTYKDASGWHNQVVDSAGDVGKDTSLALTPTGWPAISYYDGTYGASGLKYTYKSAS